MNPDNPKTIKLAEHIIKQKIKLGRKVSTDVTKAAWKIDTVSALIADAVTLLSKTLTDIENLRVKQLFCNLSESWEHGSTIYNFMKMVGDISISSSINQAKYMFLEIIRRFDRFGPF